MKKRTLFFWTMSLVSLVVLATYSFAKEVRPAETDEISVGEYVTFLNAIAGEIDEHGLYDLEVLRKEIVAQEDFFSFRKSNRVFYIAAEGVDPASSLFGLTELQALRYCNWVENGSQSALPKALAATETGSYDLTGNEIIANDGAQHHIVSNDLHPECFIITTRSSNGEEPTLSEQATDPLMMFGIGERGNGSGKKAGGPDPIHPVDSRRENESGLGETKGDNSNTARGKDWDGIKEYQQKQVDKKTDQDNIETAIADDRFWKVGLKNGGNDCFINSSLQLWKALGLPPPVTMPNLIKLFNGDPYLDCKELRLEMANQVMAGCDEFDDSQPTETTPNPAPNPRNVVNAIRTRGTAVYQSDASAFLLLLLEKVGSISKWKYYE